MKVRSATGARQLEERDQMPKQVTGECFCHGIVVTVSYGCPARPRPYTRGIDPLGGGPRASVILGVVPGTERVSHEVPLKWPAGADRLTDQPTVVEEV